MACHGLPWLASSPKAAAPVAQALAAKGTAHDASSGNRRAFATCWSFSIACLRNLSGVKHAKAQDPGAAHTKKSSNNPCKFQLGSSMSPRYYQLGLDILRLQGLRGPSARHAFSKRVSEVKTKRGSRPLRASRWKTRGPSIEQALNVS